MGLRPPQPVAAGRVAAASGEGWGGGGVSPAAGSELQQQLPGWGASAPAVPGVSSAVSPAPPCGRGGGRWG